MSGFETAVLIAGLVVVIGMGGAAAWRAVRHLEAIETAWTAPPPDPEPAAWFERLVRRRVLLHTTDDESIEGLLDEVTPDGVVLVDATYLGATSARLGGEVYVPRGRIKLVQLPRE